MTFVLGVLSMGGPVLAVLSGGIIAAAIVARDLSVHLMPKARVIMVAGGACGYVLSSGVAFVIDERLKVPLVSFSYVYAVIASSLMVMAAVLRWMWGVRTKLTVSDQHSFHSSRISL